MLDLQQHIAAVAEEKEQIAYEDLVPGVNSWVIDTGSGHNLVSKRNLTNEEQREIQRAESTLKLVTAGGVISCDEIVDVDVSKFGAAVSARVLKNTPRVLSVAKLVEEHGATFTWSREGPKLLLDGVWINLPVKAGVPLLAVPAVTTLRGTACKENPTKKNKRNWKKWG